MIRIGFIDYYLDEWHATNYPKMFAAASERIGIPCEIVGAFATLNNPNFDGKRTTDEWCRDQGIRKYENISDLSNDCDAFLIFSPDDPEQHPELAKLALPFGKPTFIDKTFAASESEAVQMIELAHKYNTPMYSTSSLRYATEVAKAKGASEISVRGNYVDMKDYLVHTAEMVVTALGTGISSVKCELEDDIYTFELRYCDNRFARIEMAPSYTFAVNGEDVVSEFFDKQIENILRFFNGEAATVTEQEMIEIARFIDAAKISMSSLGEYVEIGAT